MENLESQHDQTNQPNKKIKHIVISGGGTNGFISYGILRESEKHGFWKKDDIESIYGTSIGAIFSIIISLKFDWDTLDDYIIKRPWHTVFTFDMNSILNSFYTKGILNIHVIRQLFEPLFSAKDLNINITMKELFGFTGIDIHLYTTEYNDFKSIDISHITHPDWSVVEAVYCSCSLPLVFSPYEKDNKIYFDGGTFSNYPLYYCYNTHSDPDEIFGIKKIIDMENLDSSTMFNYINSIIEKLLYKLAATETIYIKNEIVIQNCGSTVYDIYMASSNMEERIQLIEKGKESWNRFLSSRDHEDIILVSKPIIPLDPLVVPEQPPSISS